MPRRKFKRRRRKGRDLTQMLEERKRIFEKIYCPRKAPSVEEIIQKYRKDNAFSSKYGRSVVPGITPRSCRAGKAGRLHREESLESDYSYYDTDFEEDRCGDEHLNSNRAWGDNDNINSEHVAGDSVHIDDTNSVTLMLQHSSHQETDVKLESVTDEYEDQLEQLSNTRDETYNSGGGLLGGNSNEDATRAEPEVLVSDVNAANDDVESDDLPQNNEIVNLNDNTEENNNDNRLPSDDTFPGSNQNETQISRPCTPGVRSLASVLSQHSTSVYIEAGGEQVAEEAGKPPSPKPTSSNINHNDGSQLSEVGHLVERERSNVNPTVLPKSTFDFRSQPLLTTDDDIKSKTLTDEEVERMIECTKVFDEVKAEVQDHTVQVEKFNQESQKVDNHLAGIRKSLGTCQLIWKIPDFKRKCAETGQKSVLYSPAFETHPYGYKMSISIVPNGDGKGDQKYMSIFFTIIQGRWDGILSWPFGHPLTFTLLDQSEADTVHDISARFVPNPVEDNQIFLGKPEAYRNPSLGLPRFAPLKEVWSNGGEKYVKDDTIFIKVEVDVKGEDHVGYIVTEGEIIRGRDHDKDKLRY